MIKTLIVMLMMIRAKINRLFFATTLAVFATTITLEAKKIDIFLGYIDQRPLPILANSFALQRISEKLLQKDCPENPRSCGWKYLTSHPQITFQKDQTTLRLFSGTYTQRDDLNRGVQKENQTLLSRQLEESFLASLKSSEMVLYLGHSRFGYGPDFFPPQLLGNKRVSQSHYEQLSRRRQSSLDFYFLQNSEQIQAKVIGFFSCDSNNHFLEKLRANVPQSQFVGTNQPLAPAEAIDQLLAAISFQM